MAIQESHYIPEDKMGWEKTWPGTIISSSGTNNSRGVIVLISKNLEHHIEGTHKDEGEVAGIREPVLIERKGVVAIDLPEGFQRQRPGPRVVLADGHLKGIDEDRARVGSPVR